jgi:hypothetical protein
MSRFTNGDLIKVNTRLGHIVFALKLNEYEFAFFEGRSEVFDDWKLDPENVLFVCRMNDSVESTESWTFASNIELNGIYVNPVKYLDINFTNAALYDDYLDILKTKMIPFGFAKGYPQAGGMYDVVHIENRLDDFFSNRADRYIEADIKLIEKLKLSNVKK